MASLRNLFKEVMTLFAISIVIAFAVNYFSLRVLHLPANGIPPPVLLLQSQITTPRGGGLIIGPRRYPVS